MKNLSLFGQQYGRLTVIGLAENKKGKKRDRRQWVCRCECGNVKIIQQDPLVHGLTKSCGCILKEIRTKHGRTWDKDKRRKTPEYRTWLSMKSRCYKPKATGYKNYGGRGITVCDRWLHSFENFFADMGPRPNHKCRTIDRINNEGNYEPNNCKWATYKEQATHRRKRSYAK